MVRHRLLALGQLHVGFDHHPSQRFERHLRLPAERLPCLGWITEQQIDFGRAEVSFVDFDELFPVELERAKYLIQKFANAMRFTGGDDVIIRLGLLKHQPHRLDIIAGEAPVALGFQISQEQFLLQADFDAGGRTRDFARDERLAARGDFRD